MKAIGQYYYHPTFCVPFQLWESIQSTAQSLSASACVCEFVYVTVLVCVCVCDRSPGATAATLSPEWSELLCDDYQVAV